MRTVDSIASKPNCRAVSGNRFQRALMFVIPGLTRNPGFFLDSRFGRDFNRVIYLTLEHLFEPEVEFKIVKPRDRRFYPFCREDLRHILIVLLEEVGIGGIIIGDHDGIILYPDVPL